MAVTASTALSTAVDEDPPMEAFRTAGCLALAATQSNPAMTPAQSPFPWQFRTRTATREAERATP